MDQRPDAEPGTGRHDRPGDEFTPSPQGARGLTADDIRFLRIHGKRMAGLLPHLRPRGASWAYDTPQEAEAATAALRARVLGDRPAPTGVRGLPRRLADHLLDLPPVPLRRWLATCAAIGALNMLLLYLLLTGGRYVTAVAVFAFGTTALVVYAAVSPIRFRRRPRR
ncbi:hypothetical protein [Saccharothrix sp. HUAS TT1]|uniref:hypothetical protein n=1 Tax=unclassified Saccharothrix TaxID=2593673 RepID=UPI00345C36E5